MFPSRKFDKVNDKLWPRCSCLATNASRKFWSNAMICSKTFIESENSSLPSLLTFFRYKNWRALLIFNFIHSTEDSTPTLSIHLCHLSSNRIKLNKKEIMQPKTEYNNNTKPLLVSWMRPRKGKKWRWKMKLMVAGSNVSHRKRYRIICTWYNNAFWTFTYEQIAWPI